MPHIDIAAEKIFSLGALNVTNAYLHSVGAVFVIIFFSLLISLRLALIPSILQGSLEYIVSGTLNLMTGVMGSKEKAEKYAPIVLAIFFLVLVSNWLGILPGVGSIGFYEEVEGHRLLIPLFRSAGSDLNFTLALGVTVMILVNIFGAASIGMTNHLKKFFSFKGPIDFFVGILELISEGAKAVSFSFRLFGNIIAGEVLLVIIFFLVPYGAPIPFLGLEIFVGFIQALVFAMLTMVFIAIATTEHH